jgi:hypothetical protein
LYGIARSSGCVPGSPDDEGGRVRVPERAVEPEGFRGGAGRVAVKEIRFELESLGIVTLALGICVSACSESGAGTASGGATGGAGTASTHTEISAVNREQRRPIYEMVLHHYTGRRGVDAPFTGELAGKIRPEGFHGDHPGFGTILHTR